MRSISRRAWCPSCRVHTNARRAWCPSCRRRVPCMGESRSWPVVRSESRAWASPGHGPSSAMPRPNMACSRRRHRRFTNIYSYVVPWRFSMVRSAARLRLDVGPLASRYAVAGRSRQRDIIGHIRAYPGISEHSPIPGISGHERIVACRIVRCRSHHPVWPVAAGMARRRSACGRVRRVPYRPLPDRVRYRPSLGDVSSRAGAPVAEHGVGNGRRVPYDPSPDRVPYDPSLDRVSSYVIGQGVRLSGDRHVGNGRLDGASDGIPSKQRRNRSPRGPSSCIMCRTGACSTPKTPPGHTP